MTILIILAAVFLFLYLIRSVFNIQYSLLYYPDPHIASTESLAANHLKLWRSSAVDYRGIVGTAVVKQTTGTLIVFHGNAGTAADRSYYIDALEPLGYRVVLAEYPMYGGRKGELGEEAFVKDGLETVNLAFEEYGGPLYLLGESMGCGVAAAIVSKTSVKIDGIILITPWDTLESVAREKFPFLPVRVLLRDRYDSIRNLSQYQGRIAVLGAGRDAVIPVEHARKLYDSLDGTSKKMWTFRDAGHNDWLQFMSHERWKDLMDFVGKKEGSKKQQ